MKKLTPTEENMAVAFVEWVNSFDNISHTENITDLSDGIVLFEVLAEIDPKWFKLIRSADVGDNWVFKFNNLKKLYKLVTRFYEEILGQSTDNLLAPNLNAIAKESDVVETLKLCQMVIALAVQCEHNQIYIEKIQTLSPVLQHALMLSIEQVMTRINGADVQPQTPPPSHPSRQTSYSSEDDRLYKRVELEHARIIAEKEELEKAHQELIEEHAQLRYRFDELESERLDLRARLREMEHAVEQANQTGNNNYIMRAEIEHLKQDLERSEDRRQETERLVDEQMQRISELNRKVEDLTRRAQEADRLKDQLDEYKHTAEKLHKTENVMEKYKKKLEEIVGQKKQIKALEEQNKSLVEQNKQIEEDYRKVLAFRTLMDSYKDQVAALETKNQELIREKNRLDYDVKHLAAKVEGLETERMGYTDHIQSLEDRVREMEFDGVVGLDPFFQPRPSTTYDDDDEEDSFDLSNNNLEDVLNDTNTTTLKLKIARLERQIKTLQEEKGDSTGGPHAFVLEHQLEDANRLKEKFEKDYVDAASERDILEADMMRIKEGIPAALQSTSNSTMALRAHIIDLEKETASLRERIDAMESKVQADIGATAATALTTASSSVPNSPSDISEHASISELREQIRQQSEQIKQQSEQNRQQSEQIHKLMLEKDRLQTQQIEDKNRLLETEKINNQLNNQLKSNPVGLKSIGGDEVSRQLREENANLQKQISDMQVKMQKAKEFIKQQDKLFKETKANQPKDNSYEEAVKSLQAQVESKEKEIDNLKKQIREVRIQSRREQQLILAAWLDLGRRLQRDSTNLRSLPSSWLAQQRQTLENQLKRRG